MGENWLLIETSNRAGEVGIARDGALVDSRRLDAARRHARDLTTTLATLLREAAIQPRDLTGVMVSCGPGSYTALRVGLMTGKALAYALGCSLVAVPTFHAVAEQAPAETRSLWVIEDALQGLVYAQWFERDDTDRLRAMNELCICPGAAWLSSLTPGTRVSGPGLRTWSGLIPDTCPLVAEPNREPTVEGLHRAGQRMTPLTREEQFRLEPLYLRGSSAEEKAKRAHESERPA